TQDHQIQIKKIWCSIIAIVIASSCAVHKGLSPHRLSGMALGTFYQIDFYTQKPFPAQNGIDSIFRAVDKSISNYRDDSVIARLNAGDTSVVADDIFRAVFKRSKEIHRET